MRHEFGSLEEPGVLTPKIPLDIGAQSQRQRILGAMARSCAEKSFARTTIADIVERASISRATFYKHFADKRECFDTAVFFFVGELETAAREAQSATESSPEAIQRSIAAMLELLAEKAAYAKLLLVQAPIVDPTIIGRQRDLVIEAVQTQWAPGKGGPSAGADANLAYGRALVLIADQLAAGRVKQLPQLLPELVYIALLPFLGHDEALAQTQVAR